MAKRQKNIKKPSEICLVCDCRSEIFRVEYDPDIDMADIAIYTYGYKMSLWQKLRYIYSVIVKGKPFGDQVMLNKQQIKALANFLNSVL